MNQLLPKYFGFDPATTTIRTEIIAGVSTFLTMAYILAVNPAILGITGMDKGALFATTAITSGIATLITSTILGSRDGLTNLEWQAPLPVVASPRPEVFCIM